MTSMADSTVNIQTSPEVVASLPCWFGEVTLMAHYLGSQGALRRLEQQVRFARRRFGRYDVLDFVAMLLSYALSGERTLEAFYERLRPFASALMALFGREHLPHRSTLSRFLASLDQPTVEALRSFFLQDLLARRWPQSPPGGLWDRQQNHWLVFDVDGTRQAARQRALPHGPQLPEAQRRLREACAPGYRGRKRGEVVRTRTVVQQAHTHHWLATFGGAGNGDYRGELRRAVETIQQYLQAHAIAPEQALVRLDGQYGSGGVLAALNGLAYVTRGSDYQLLDRPEVQARLQLPSTQQITHPETGVTRQLYDCPDLAITVKGDPSRVIVATHPASARPATVGSTREGIVYELGLPTLPISGFSAADVVALYLHRGAFEPTLADEDQEQDPDRWCSHSVWGQEFWQILSQWVWNLRLELGDHLAPSEPRTTEFAPALPVAPQVKPLPRRRSPHFGPPELVHLSRRGCLPASAFELQEDGTLRCPAGNPLYPQDQRREKGGRLRVIYGARLAHCRACPLREQCQGADSANRGPRQVSAILHPLPPVPRPTKVSSWKTGTAALLWQDWSRCAGRRNWMQLLRSQRVDLQMTAPILASFPANAPPLSRARRAHWRLSWEQRLARNAREQGAPSIQVVVFGVPSTLATFLALPSI